jgi:hypothetical protein
MPKCQPARTAPATIIGDQRRVSGTAHALGVTQLQPVTSFTTPLYDRGHLLGSYTALLDPDRPVPFGSWFAAPGR